jgi:hypothetical protein
MQAKLETEEFIGVWVLKMKIWLWESKQPGDFFESLRILFSLGYYILLKFCYEKKLAFLSGIICNYFFQL